MDFINSIQEQFLYYHFLDGYIDEKAGSNYIMM